MYVRVGTGVASSVELAVRMLPSSGACSNTAMNVNIISIDACSYYNQAMVQAARSTASGSAVDVYAHTQYVSRSNNSI